MSRQVKCPRCQQLTYFTSENPYRPFCTERCKMIDRGNWAEGKYAIPVSSQAAQSSDSAAHSEDEEQDSPQKQSEQ